MLIRDILQLIFLELDRGCDMLNFSELSHSCHQTFRQQIKVIHLPVSLCDDNETKWMENNQNLFHGIYRQWNEKGQLLSESNYYQGKQHGISRMWYSNGQLKFKTSYIYNKPHGIFHGWYFNGQLLYEHNYYQGRQHGIFRWWYSDGKPRSESNYLQGQKHGIFRKWNLNGQIFEQNYFHGNEIEK